MIHSISLIKQLKLEPHPEGGYFKELSRSEIIVPFDRHEEDKEAFRNLYTSIYFLLEAGAISKFHRLKSDEIWYYHYGDSMQIECLTENGKHYTEKLGPNISVGESFQVLIPAGTIFGAKTSGQKKFSLVGCLVSPGFDFRDFTLYKAEELHRLYPEYKSLISEFT
jgi:uncharacterized protein